jgi:uncharacterized protein (DUF2141 family)
MRIAGCAAGALLVAACASSASLETQGPSEGAPWHREVAPFPVTGPAGGPYDEPFLGGFDHPRPQLVDIDGDGDADLFIQERTGSVRLFERLDGPTPRYAWRTDEYHGLDVGEWYRFVDIDGDGDFDLLAEERFSYLSYYRNEGSAAAPRFVLAADTLRDAAGEPIFSDRQNIPNATDIDCDGRMDLLIGRLAGTVSHFQQAGTDANGAPVFSLVTDRFEGIEIVAQLGSAHGANTMALGDVDGDGDEDLLWGDFFEPGLLFIENRGSCDRPSLRAEPRPFPLVEPLTTSGYNAPTLGDVDVDGDADVLVGVLGGAFNPSATSIDNLHWLEQDDLGGFSERTARFIGTLDVGSESVPVVVDLDGDGVLDLLVSNKVRPDDPQNGAVHRFMNTGSRDSPALAWDGTLDGLVGGYHVMPAFGDLDGDGDRDAIVGTWLDELAYFRNDAEDGGIRLSLVDSAFVALTRGRNAAPALGDLDGDGDLDLVVGEASGELNYYRNDGTREEPVFVLESDSWMGIDVGQRSFPVLEDTDGDGDLDMLVGAESAGILLFLNEGTREAPSFRQVPGGLPVPHFGHAAPAFADLDGDGDRDLLLGGSAGGLWYFERR